MKIEKGKRRPWAPKRKAQTGRKEDHSSFYNSTAWRKLSKARLAKHPLCVHCQARGILKEAAVTDHVIPIRQGGEAWETSNMQSLCHQCHNRKSAKEKL